MGTKCPPLKISQTYFLIFPDCKIAFSSSKTLIKEGVNEIAGLKRKRKALPGPAVGMVPGVLVCFAPGEAVPGSSRASQLRSAVALEAAGFSSAPFSSGSELRALACPPVWSLVVRGVDAGGDVVEPQCCFPWWVF